MEQRSTPKIVAHSVRSYLFRTGSWIYGQISHLKQFHPIVIATRTLNTDIFPWEDVYALSDLSPINRFFQKEWGRRTLFQYPYFAKILKKRGVALLHSHFGNRGFLDLKLKRKLGIPQLVSFYGHDVSMLPQKDAWKRNFEELFHWGDLFLAEGNYMRESLIDLGCPASKVVVQHLGVDLEAIPFIPRGLKDKGPIRVLVAGTFREKKGITYAVEAFARVASGNKPIELTLIGDAGNSDREIAYKEEILKVIADRKIGDRVRQMGFLSYPDFVREVRESDLVLSPSIHPSDGETEGGAPVTLIEMSASGMPIISTYHCDIPEVVVDGESGLLVPERDIDALAERLEYLVNHPEKWEEMGRAGRQHIEAEYDVRKQVPKLEKLYAKAL